MALTISAVITVADDEAYTAREAAILAALQAHPSNGVTVGPVVIANPAAEAQEAPAQEAPAQEAETVEEKPKRTRRAPKAAPAPETEASTTPAVLDTTLDEKPLPEATQAAHEEMQAVVAARQAEEAEAADLIGEAKEYTLDDAVKVGTEFLKAGKQAEVKAALAAAGNFSRVSELKGDAIGAFITALTKPEDN